jgi:hypothetical protein
MGAGACAVRMSTEEYRKLAQKPRKYRNIPTILDGQRFDSKLEAKRYTQLRALEGSGAVSWFIRQAPFRLPGGVIYRADFLVVWQYQRVTVEDCKGVMTPVSALKIKQVEEIYHLKVELIRA